MELQKDAAHKKNYESQKINIRIKGCYILKKLGLNTNDCCST